MAWVMVGESGRSRNTKLLITGCYEHNTTQSEFVKLASLPKRILLLITVSLINVLLVSKNHSTLEHRPALVDSVSLASYH